MGAGGERESVSPKITDRGSQLRFKSSTGF